VEEFTAAIILYKRSGNSVKRKLDLRTGIPVWAAFAAPRIATTALRHDARCDALVVGLGISGAMVAEKLSASGLSVMGVDRRGPMLGSTAATTALVQFEIDQPLTRLVTQIGEAQAVQAWRRSRLAVINLRGRIEELGIDCDLAVTRSLYLAGNSLGPGGLREEAAARRAAGLSANYLPPSKLKEQFGIERKGAILSHDNLALDPRKLTAGLLKKAAGRKTRLHAPVEVTSLEAGPRAISARTKDGPTITARYVVLATGYELLSRVPSTGHSVVSTYAIATKPQRRALWPGPAFIWEASDPYLYARATPDGRVICGGEDEDFENEEARDALIEVKARRIAAKLKKLFPELETTPEFSWAGSFGTTATGLPCIGMLPNQPNVFALQGYGGNGITYSQIGSEIIATTIEGRADQDAPLFDFGRKVPPPRA